MMSIPEDPETEVLLARARQGDQSAVEGLLAGHRGRLRQMVAVRMDPQLSARVDPSDVVQEALVAASQRLSEYLRNPPLPFYPWLRQIAWDRLVDLHRRHIRAGSRTVTREEPLGMSDTSAMQLADRLLTGSTSLLKRLLRKELLARVQLALAELAPDDREILVLRHLEQSTTAECAAILGISETAAKQRHLRAVRRLRKRLGDTKSGGLT
jgi:RNA polymerase sigma-70 factor (ECF subfamily)